MSVNLSVSSPTPPQPSVPVERTLAVVAAPKVKAPENNGPGSTNTRAVAAISTTAELKRAENTGTSVTISDEQLIKAIDHAIKLMAGYSTSLEFSVHEKTHQIMVKVLDKETGKVIREIPPEKTLDFVAKLWEMAGILIDKRG